MEKQLQYAKWSGIEVPEDLLKAVDETKIQITNLHEKKSNLESEIRELEAKIKDSIAKEASALVNNADSGKLSAVRKKAENRLGELKLLLSEIKTFESPAQNGLSAAKEKLSAFIRDRLAEGRAEMERQLENAMMERARLYGTMRHGDKVFTTPPEKNSKSKIAVCEVCKQDIGLFEPNEIKQPIVASHFQKLPRFEYPPFNPRAGIEYFQCPVCRKRPWGGFDRILTNFGYFVLKEDDQNAEQA